MKYLAQTLVFALGLFPAAGMGQIEKRLILGRDDFRYSKDEIARRIISEIRHGYISRIISSLDLGDIKEKGLYKLHRECQGELSRFSKIVDTITSGQDFRDALYVVSEEDLFSKKESREGFKQVLNSVKGDRYCYDIKSRELGSYNVLLNLRPYKSELISSPTLQTLSVSDRLNFRLCFHRGLFGKTIKPNNRALSIFTYLVSDRKLRKSKAFKSPEITLIPSKCWKASRKRRNL